MVVCDVVRMVVAALMAIPGTAAPFVCGLIIVLTAAGGPFRAAQLALLPDVLEGERYIAGLAIRNVTFAASATLVWAGVHQRRAAADVTSSVKTRWSRAFSGAGAQAMWRNPGVRALFLLKMLAGFAIAPEGLAAPYAAELGAATFAVGLILASDPVGSVVGA
jgi:hypothetical protein